ncbi:ATP-binding protein [Demequina sp. SO4-13]|uniref:ATP-binding protein n=1 Tax=Demequina sp. SO4-13 TaxID=3401027 RepID=UPI003AF9FF5E
MLQRLGIRGKLLAVVAVPILVLVLAAGFITFGSVQDLSAARNTSALVDTLAEARSLESVLQEERRAAINFVSSEDDGSDALTAAISATGWALTDVGAAIDAFEPAPDAEEQDDRAAQLREQVVGVLGSTENAAILEAERAVEVVPAAGGEWATFPDEATAAAMTQGYETAATGIESIAADAPGAVSEELRALADQIRAENEAAQAAYVEPERWKQALQELYPEVDAAVAGLLEQLDQLGADDRNQAAVASLLEGRDLLGNLESTRDSTRSLSVLVATLTGYYDGALGSISAAPDDVVVAVSDPELIETLRAYGDLSALDERMLREGLLAERIIRVGAFAPDGGEINLLQDYQLRTNLALERAQASSLALGDDWALPPFGASTDITGNRAESFVSTRTSISSGLDFSVAQEDPDVWAGAVDAEAEQYEAARESVLGEIESRASAASQAALTQLLLTIAIAALVIIVSIVVALLIARRIIGPLRRLTTTATAVRQELPRLVERVAMPGETVDVNEVQIPVESSDEVGRLAEAFNGVNAATLAIAGEQAALRGSISEMFVNVARRDQVLLNRQLSSIDEMERSEDNQETLTNLFALDHLATRMRRNSESLLVLAGIDTGRRLRRPMPLSDVVRTASSEIEMYERVQLELDADPPMLGHSALIVAHMLAELLENATVFSDPDTAVVVRTSERGDDFVVEIEDAGIGMTEKELGAANDRVDSTAASEILGAQRLGLFVVGRIARRVGARIELQSQEGAGTLAIVAMPRALFVRDEDVAPRHAASPAADEEAQAPTALLPHDGAEELTHVADGSRPDAYIPTVIEEGASLTGRADLDAADPDSIEARIAADAAAAPTAEPTNPEELTTGTSSAGLPARRRRGATAAEDASREQTSIVGLPARATDAQMSALAAEQAGGFTPAISPTEITPQSPEQRSSMFRGFRSRRETEEQVGGAPEASFAPELPRREQPSIPSLEPDHDEAADAFGSDDAHPAESTDLGAAGVGGLGGLGESDADAGEPEPSAPTAEQAQASETAPTGAPEAAGAVAFFSRRERHRGTARQDADRSEGVTFSDDAVPTESDSPSDEAVQSEQPAQSEDAPLAASDGLPLFRMPKLSPAPAEGSERTANAAPSEPEPLLEPDHDEPRSSELDAAPARDDGPFVVPSLELDDDEDESPAASYAPADGTPEHDAAPEFGATPEYEAEPASYGGVEHVSLADDATQHADSPYAPSPDAAPWDAGAGTATPELGVEAPLPWHSQIPAQPETRDDAASAPGFMPSPEVAADEWTENERATHHAAPADEASEEPAGPQVATPVLGAVPVDQSAAPGHPAAEPAAEQSPSLDALIQSAVDDETEQRPGFFSRLFGRGRRGDSRAQDAGGTAPGAPAAQWAATDAPSSLPSAATPPPVGVYQPVTDQPVAPASWQSAPETASAPESQPAHLDQPSAASALPTSFAPAAADPPYQAPASAAPQHDAQPTDDDVPWWERTEAEPAGQQPEEWQEPHSAPQAFEPGVGDGAEAEEWPTTAPSAASSAAGYTPDELAQASGWETAGASALEAAEPDGATTYQPVIQPDNNGDGGADLTSAVFSELSSLASERPKVEKTRAGLQRRRPADAAPVEVRPIEEDASLAPAERDADAVRSRFSSFYSGTKRARDDVAAFERQTEPAEASDS